MMSFSILPNELKVKIFNMLSIGNRYNASIVWEEMAEEDWISVPLDGEPMRRLKSKYPHIKNLVDLVRADVLITAGHLNALEEISIEYIDLSNEPFNIINNLTKIISNGIRLYEVIGFDFSMLKNSKCKNLHFEGMMIPEVESDISICGKVTLNCVSGDLIRLFGKISCDQLEISEMKLSSSETKSLLKLLDSGVRELEIYGGAVDTNVLADYDGQGWCERIWLSAGNQLIGCFKTWAYSVGWIWKKVENRKCRSWLMLEKSNSVESDDNLFTLLPFN